MVLWQAASPTKRARVAAPALGRGGSGSVTWLPRPTSYSATVQLDVPRLAVGVNEYLYALSLRHPEAVRCGSPRCKHSLLRPCAPSDLQHGRAQVRRAARRQPLGARAR